MATYIELRNLFANDEFKNRIDIAVVVAANELLGGTPTVSDQKWAAYVFSNPRSEGQKALMSVLATNKAASTSAITSATDAAIQTAVDLAVPSLITAYTG